MKTLNDLCKSIPADDASESLRQACALPRVPADMQPLPDPHAEAAFDSSWETLQAAADAAAGKAEDGSGRKRGK